MDGANNLIIAAASARAVLSRAAQRVEKAAASADLSGKNDDFGAANQSASRRFSSSRLSLSGMNEAAPSWNGQRLVPAFVAQVLGQVFPTSDVNDYAEARAAYANSVRTGTITRAKIYA